jgi:glycosyltransferase involved in cell wall biosynthesis
MGLILERRVRLRLVVPLDVHAATGGNAYDLALARAMEADGDHVEVLRVDASELVPTLAAPWSGHTLVDGLLACPHPEAIVEARPAVLVHMPLGLDDDLPASTAGALQARERRALRAAAQVVATSRWSADLLRARHGIEDVAVVAPGVDPAPVSEGSDPPLIVHLAAVVPNKNQVGVVRALAQLRDLPWRARLAGSLDRDPVYAAAVRHAVDAGDLSARVDLPGVLDRDAAWVGADLALLPSRAEAYGMAVTEALARGVPAIVGDGGAAEALGYVGDAQRPGIVVPAGDDGALTAALRHWLSDPALQAALRARALTRRASLADWPTTARSMRAALTRAPSG